MKANTFYEESDYDPRYALTDDDMSGVVLAGLAEKKRIVKRFPRGVRNLFTLSDLLAAGSGVDDKADPSSGHGRIDDSVRKDGAQVQLNLAYNNVRCNGSLSCAFGTVPTVFRYRVSFVPNANFVASEILEAGEGDDSGLPRVDNSDPTVQFRVKRERKGIHVHADMGGRIGRFSFQVLLINLVSGLGMATLAIAFVDFLARYVLPKRNVYNKQMVREFGADVHQHKD